MIPVFKDKLDVLFLVFVFLVLAVVVIAVLSAPPEEITEPEKTCTENETRDCMKGPCEGMQTCINEEWGKCTVEIICTPGTKTPCVVDHCSSAYKVCNDCGTGYGECTAPE